MNTAIQITQGAASDLGILKSWLSAAGLPIEDLTVAHMRNFLIATTSDALVGMIGLEQFEDVGLLRSLVVDPSARGDGVGRQLVTALEKKANGDGVAELWLMTTDADVYFARLDYEIVSRDAAPAAIQATDEFSGLCPGDATLMRKKLLERLLSPLRGP